MGLARDYLSYKKAVKAASKNYTWWRETEFNPHVNWVLHPVLGVIFDLDPKAASSEDELSQGNLRVHEDWYDAIGLKDHKYKLLRGYVILDHKNKEGTLRVYSDDNDNPRILPVGIFRLVNSMVPGSRSWAWSDQYGNTLPSEGERMTA